MWLLLPGCIVVGVFYLFCENTKHSKLLNKHKTDILAPMAWPSVLFLANQYFSLYDHSYESYGADHCSQVAPSMYGVYFGF